MQDGHAGFDVGQTFGVLLQAVEESAQSVCRLGGLGAGGLQHFGDLAEAGMDIDQRFQRGCKAGEPVGQVVFVVQGTERLTSGFQQAVGAGQAFLLGVELFAFALTGG